MANQTELSLLERKVEESNKVLDCIDTISTAIAETELSGHGNQCGSEVADKTLKFFLAFSQLMNTVHQVKSDSADEYNALLLESEADQEATANERTWRNKYNCLWSIYLSDDYEKDGMEFGNHDYRTDIPVGEYFLRNTYENVRSDSKLRVVDGKFDIESTYRAFREVMGDDFHHVFVESMELDPKTGEVKVSTGS